MKLNLREIPFSMRGSYLAISEMPENLPGIFRDRKIVPGLYLRCVHGISYLPCIKVTVPVAARMVPLWAGQPDSYTVEATQTEVVIRTGHGTISMCYANSDTMLVRGIGEQTGIRFELNPDNFAHEVPYRGKTGYLCNCSDIGRRFLFQGQQGALRLNQDWNGSGASFTHIQAEARDGEFMLVIEDVATEWVSKIYDHDYASCKETMDRAFSSFLASMPEVPEEYADTRAVAAYVDWSSIVNKAGTLTRDAMLMSKNWMCSIWSWDHCFNAMALAYNNPKLAWDQFILLFDYQDETGVIPDGVNDVYAAYTYCKPPIHGWALSKLMQVMQLSSAQLSEAYDKLSKWTTWWLNYRDHDNDGICEYYHGNDSGWDNSTVFVIGPNVESPDLTAFLIIQMDVLSDLAKRLGIVKDAEAWKAIADQTLAAMLEHCFDRNKPVARICNTHTVIKTDSLILYLPIVLGKRLPEAVRNSLVTELKKDRFFTEYGFATESPHSPLYESDGYWRGPIWAPSTMMILDGLAACGEIAMVRDVARRFAHMCSTRGFAENFDALTGEGLRDRAYTWTASVFLLLAHEYLL